MTNCHILRKVIILQSPLIRGEKEKQQLFYFWYTLSKMFFGHVSRKNTFYFIVLLNYFTTFTKSKMIKS